MTPQTKSKLPKGRVHYYSPDCKNPLWPFGRQVKNEFYTEPCAVLPCQSRKEAQAWVRLHGMDEEEIIALIKQKCRGDGDPVPVRAALRALNLGSKP